VRIALEGLSKSYGRVTALRDVSLSIEPGQIVALLGSNGAGKTTLLRALAGVVGLSKGAIYYDGTLFRRDRLELRRRLCFLPDFPPMFPMMTVLAHIGMCLRLYGRDGEQPRLASDLGERVLALLHDFELMPLAGAPIRTLSRGQAYKTALVGLLAVDPDLWLLDEPFASGVDPQGIRAIKMHTTSAAQRGRTVIYSTQILDIAEDLSHRVCVLDRGEMKAFEHVDRLRTLAAGTNEGALEALFRRLREQS